jgi:23S rRNA (uracil1939-C5)-methyltransferase
MSPGDAIRCPHRPDCPGCPLLERPQGDQLRWKTERVREALAPYPGLGAIAVADCLPPSSPTGYRTRLKLAVVRDGDVRIGLFRAGSHDVVDIPECRVAHPPLLEVIDLLRRLLRVPAPPVAHVDARASRADGVVHVTLVTPAGDDDRFAALAETIGAGHPSIRGVARRILPGGPVPRALGGRTFPLWGESAIHERIGTVRCRLSPGAFFQADPATAETLRRVVRDGLFGTEPAAGMLCDLYAGSGAFALALAPFAARTVAVEPIEAACDDAVASARDAGIPIEVVRRTAEAHAAMLVGDPPEVVVLDAPRRGVSPGVLRGIAAARPRRIALVACDPEAFARDLDVLGALGFAPRSVQPIDMFALTAEVETAAILEPGSLVPPRVVARGGDAVAVLKPAVVPTHPQGRGETSLRDIARAGLHLPDLQPVHRLDAGTSGHVWFARGEALRSLGRAFETGAVHKEYLALVRGIPRKTGTIRLAGRDGSEETRYRLERIVGGYGLVRAFPKTGRRHQIRRHLARIGRPIAGDERYGSRATNRFLAETCGLLRPFLHLAVTELPGPDGGILRAETPLPPELAIVLRRLETLRTGTTAVGVRPEVV